MYKNKLNHINTRYNLFTIVVVSKLIMIVLLRNNIFTTTLHFLIYSVIELVQEFVSWGCWFLHKFLFRNFKAA